MIMQVLI